MTGSDKGVLVAVDGHGIALFCLIYLEGVVHISQCECSDDGIAIERYLGVVSLVA